LERVWAASGAALQHPHRGELSLLGAALHSVPRESPPRELGESQVGAFLTHLAVDRRMSANTQNQALNALVFLYKAVLERPLGDMGGVVRARRLQRLPVVLHVSEVKALLRHLEGIALVGRVSHVRLGAAVDGGAAVAG